MFVVPFADPSHRPWPPPDRPWVLAMRWLDLAFLHWRFPPRVVAPLLPAGVRLDTFDGDAWLGVVPFRMAGVRPRCSPALPGLSSFPEINLRTYVVAGGRPGVWFFSLDVTRRLAVTVARRLFHLPYFHARMHCRPLALGALDVHDRSHGDGVDYASVRVGGPRADFRARYRPTGPARRAPPGSVEHWLTERYCLYTTDRRGRLLRGDVHHAPWPLQPAEVDLRGGDLFRQVGLTAPAAPPLVHFARALDVVAWAPRLAVADPD